MPTSARALEINFGMGSFQSPYLGRFQSSLTKPTELADERAEELPVSGMVFEGRVSEWLRALHTAHPIEVI